MLIPVVIFVACLCAGVMAGVRWLPDLAVEPVGGLAFFVVCGLLGGALGLVGLHVYSIVEELDHGGPLGSFRNGEIVAIGLRSMLWEAGSLCGLAIAVYLLAPPQEVTEEPDSPAARPVRRMTGPAGSGA